MLPTYQTNADAVLTIPYPMDGASLVSPATVEYEVLDEVGGIVLDRTAVTDLGGPNVDSLTLTIPHNLNMVPEGAIRALRTVRVFFKPNSNAEITQTVRYVIEVADKLVVMGNSFQTYETALLTRLEMPALEGWDEASEGEQIAALITARDNICRLTFRYRISQEALEWDSLRAPWGMYRYVTDMRLRGFDDFAEFPADFQRALMRAQLFEADTILAGDPIGDRRSAGIISETTGEAKMFFSNRPALRHPVAAATLNVLASYLHRANTLGRG